jgi:transposase
VGKPNRKSYQRDVSNEAWTFVAPYLALVREHAPQRHHDQREVLNGLRWFVRTGSPDRGYAAFWHPLIANLYSAHNIL